MAVFEKMQSKHTLVVYFDFFFFSLILWHSLLSRLPSYP